jgi:hypothetical protein
LSEPVEPLPPAGPLSLLRRPFAIVEEKVRVPLLERPSVLALRGALGRELPHRVEHAEARLHVSAGIRPEE